MVGVVAVGDDSLWGLPEGVPGQGEILDHDEGEDDNEDDKGGVKFHYGLGVKAELF